MRRVVVFDFDGTLTRKDTFLEFIRFTHGAWSLYAGLLLYAPLLILMKLHLYDNGKAKERLFSHFFKGWRYEAFKRKGEEFAGCIERFKRDDILTILKSHVEAGNDVYVVSASMPEWVAPWCYRQGVCQVLGTLVEAGSDGLLTGRFASPNCYGQEKVNRLLGVEPHRSQYHLSAYGDSRGDKEMMEFADDGLIC